MDEVEGRKLNFLYRKSGIETRYSVLTDFDKVDSRDFRFFPSNEELEPFPSTKARMRVFEENASRLGVEASLDCLRKAGAEQGEITHLILVSCTGMTAPGVELELMQSLQLPDSVERYCLHFMGCYAAFTGIKLADKIVRSEPEAKVLLVCVELCTLHFQKDYSEDHILANSLFGDGAAAALITRSKRGFTIKSYLSQVLRQGVNDMAWSIGDFGFEMRLTKYIPALLEGGIHQLKGIFEQRFGLSKIKNFAIHPGGKQILNKVQEAFGLDQSVNKHALEVLKKFGNMSSATILFVLAQMMEDSRIEGDILAMGFGPGLTLETLLLEKS